MKKGVGWVLSELISGFIFALGWFMARLCVSFAVSFMDKILYLTLPVYRDLIDEVNRKKRTMWH